MRTVSDADRRTLSRGTANQISSTILPICLLPQWHLPGTAAKRTRLYQRYALEDAMQAHRDLEARKTTGSPIFVI